MRHRLTIACLVRTEIDTTTNCTRLTGILVDTSATRLYGDCLENSIQRGILDVVCKRTSCRARRSSCGLKCNANIVAVLRVAVFRPMAQRWTCLMIEYILAQL